MILEGAHRQTDRLRNYLARDVDTYCTNKQEAKAIESGETSLGIEFGSTRIKAVLIGADLTGAMRVAYSLLMGVQTPATGRFCIGRLPV